MTFKMVTRSEKAAFRVAGSALAHAELIAAQQTARWRDRLPENQEVLDVEQHQRFHAEELRHLREELRQKEREHLDLLEEIRQIRERRGAAMTWLRERLFALRDIFKGAYGADGPRALFSGKPSFPVDATPLVRIGLIVVENLGDQDLALPEPILKGGKPARKTLAREIREPLSALVSAMEELEATLPGVSQTLAAKQRAHASVDQKSARLARYLEALYELEGQDELAARVRQSSHHSKSEEDEARVSRERDHEERADGEALEATDVPPETREPETGEPGEPESPPTQAVLTSPATVP